MSHEDRRAPHKGAAQNPARAGGPDPACEPAQEGAARDAMGAARDAMGAAPHASPAPDAMAARLKAVQNKIIAACEQCGRAPSEVRLLAVSKTKPIELINEIWRAGQKRFGENYAQEAATKIAALPQAEWHFIGGLQSNKAKLIVGRCALIHSVDRLSLAEEISRIAVAQGLTQDILMQVRIGDEQTKQGVTVELAPQLIANLQNLPGLRLCGIMSLPPLTEIESTARHWFATLREAAQLWRDRELSGAERKAAFCELSLGTSSDYSWAILEGATYVRVGTAIFGAREN